MSDFEQLDIHKAKELIDAKDVIIVDIRDEEAYKEAHIPAAISINEETLEPFLKTADKTKSLVCYCYHGHSSQSAAQYFVEQGFQNVFSIIGGFEKWRVSYPISEGAI